MSDLSVLGRLVMKYLRCPSKVNGEFIKGKAGWIAPMVATAWTGHSERATLPSALAALGISKEERNPLGRWSPEGSDDYVRSYRALTKKLLSKFCEAVKAGNAYEDLDEDHTFSDLKDAMEMKGYPGRRWIATWRSWLSTRRRG